MKRPQPRLPLWRWFRVGAALVVLFAALDPARPAAAHASLLSATPSDGATVPDPPQILRLDFNEPVSPLVMRLVRPSGQVVTLTDFTAADASVTIVAPAMPDKGSYVLSWRVISADSHPVGGVVTFAVGHPSSVVDAPPVEGVAAVHFAIWAAQFVLSIALFVGIGGMAFEAWLAAKRPMLRRNDFAVLIACGALAAIMSVPLQGLDALAEPLRNGLQPGVWVAGFRTSWGSTAALALAALAIGLLALRIENRAVARLLAVLAVAGIGLALAASGHASTAAPRILTVPSVFIHGVCVAVWIGSLLPLALTVRSGDHLALERFSRLIPVPLVLLVTTGIVLACVQLDRPDALWTTAYGRVLSVKLVIVLVLMLFAALNRYVLVPRLVMPNTRGLISIMASEFVFAAVILGLVGLWRFTPPPRALAAAETTYIHFHGEQAMAEIDVTPERDRGAAVSIAVTDSEFRPVEAKEVTLSIWNPAAGIEPIRRGATLAGGSQWRIAGLHIPLAGIWRMRIEILINDFDKVMIEDNVELPRAP